MRNLYNIKTDNVIKKRIKYNIKIVIPNEIADYY